MTEVKIGGVSIVEAGSKPQRISALIWGTTGGGKTTLACTAPGRKLILNFDPDGPMSISGRTDVDVADFAGSTDVLVEQFKDNENPFGLKAVLEKYDTFIVDSVSMVAEMTLSAGVRKSKAMSTSGGGKISLEVPGLQSYQIRNSLALQLVTNMLAFTARHNKHIIFIAHEAAPDRDGDGVIQNVSVLLGGQLPELVGLKFSEIWCLYDNQTTKQKLILIRPARSRKPCKTRMFQTTGAPEFEWKFNPETLEGEGLASWFKKYLDNGQQKIPLPK
jgi:hypothetical protein